MKKKIVYIDMDGVLVDFPSAFPKIDKDILEKYGKDKDEIPNIFSVMEPMKGALEAFDYIADQAETYILSTAPWENPSAWSDKLLWVKKHLGKKAHKRLILSHNKHLNGGDILIDDRDDKNGADKFVGEFIHFGSEKYPDWEAVISYLKRIL